MISAPLSSDPTLPPGVADLIEELQAKLAKAERMMHAANDRARQAEAELHGWWDRVGDRQAKVIGDLKSTHARQLREAEDRIDVWFEIATHHRDIADRHRTEHARLHAELDALRKRGSPVRRGLKAAIRAYLTATDLLPTRRDHAKRTTG